MTISIIETLAGLREAGGQATYDSTSGGVAIDFGRGIPAAVADGLREHRDELVRLLKPQPMSQAEVKAFADANGLAHGEAALLGHARERFCLLGLSLEQDVADEPKSYRTRRAGHFVTTDRTIWSGDRQRLVVPAGTPGVCIADTSEIADRFARIGMEGFIASAEKRGQVIEPVWLEGQVRGLEPRLMKAVEFAEARDMPGFVSGKPWAEEAAA